MPIQDNNNICNMTNDKKLVYAGFFARLAAYLVDMILIGLPLLILRVPMFFISLSNPDFFLLKPVLFDFTSWAIFLYILKVLYFVLMTYFKGATIGKYLFRLKVVSDNPEEGLSFTTVLYRETIGRYLSSLLYIGYIMVGASNDKRGLHDMICDTHVAYLL